MTYPDSNLIYGYARLAHMLGMTPNALHQRKHRGRFTLKPVFHIGRTAVFDRRQANVYMQQFEADAKRKSRI
ncbi:hypothetical protein [Pusillimonas sp. ANT_WB101]|uniref:hypothetical protein n=1 Tax=Pusillimonas sp. ANT_WB101 TaxID=2597356 RepID=UPI0011EBF32B|nr:hypothetical protein [Pusillimonas sp. ANT_WB101]KAA0888480.1 hypothetical protein FQ179_21170 [Pusillimonas sp. ANT_WB101]